MQSSLSKETYSKDVETNLGVNTLLLKANGVGLKGKIIFFSLKYIYLTTRLLARLVLGRKKRDAIYINREISFGGFLYFSTRLLKLHDSFMLEIKSPKYGYTMHCPMNNDGFVILTGHEGDIIDQFIIKEGNVVVDVGAHIGLYTIISSKRVGPKGKVVAVEAHPGNFEMLGRNTKLNNLNNVLLLNCAASSKKSKVKLLLPDTHLGYTGHNTIMLEPNTPILKDDVEVRQPFVEVDGNTIDDLLQKNGIYEVNWIKIDVEGAELEVLKGAHNTLSNSKNITLLIEIHNKNFYEPIQNLLKLYNLQCKTIRIYDNGIIYVIARNFGDS